MARQTHRTLDDDSGVALLTVLGVMLVITVLAIGSYALATQALHESVRVEGETQAFRAASSGLERVLSTFTEAEAQAMLGGSPITGSTPDGAYVVQLEDLGNSEWRLSSVGTQSDGVVETVRQQFYFIDLWKMNFSAGSQSLMSGSSALNGTSSIVGPFYMKGDLEIQANMAVVEGPLFVKNGNITLKNANSWVGLFEQPMKVYCDKAIPANVGNGSGKGTGVYVSHRIRSVPDISLPEITQAMLDEWATIAKNESTDNIMGRAALANLESSDGNTSSYTTMQPPNTMTWSRRKAQTGAAAAALPYKFIGDPSGVPSPRGSGATPLTIGGTGSFGAWGSVNTTDGVSLAAGPAGSSGYPAGRSDDFAYDDANNILYIHGTVFVDGPLTINDDIYYIGNGTIVANGHVRLNGNVRPYFSSAIANKNIQGENNRWALGISTPGDMYFEAGGNSPMAGTSAGDRDALRDLEPNYAGAFYVGSTAYFNSNNMLVRGTVLSNQMRFDKNNNLLITNPLLPSYLPDSLPGAGAGIMSPGLWSRG
jgi:Tfp pilus assembly protein PilX